MKEKLNRLQRDFEELREEQKDYVTMKHFDAVVEPIKLAITTMQKDVKEILRAVSERHHHSR